MSEKILSSVHQGILHIGGVELECHVLENGKRIFSTKDFLKAFCIDYNQRTPFAALKKFLLRVRFISIGNENLTNPIDHPIKFKDPTKGNLINNGYAVELLPEICDAVIKLANRMTLSMDYNKALEQGRKLLKSFAQVGIIALVDEATGYQDFRDKNALQTILNQFLKKEHAAWAKKFPDEFYIQMFKLKKWEWKDIKINRPGIVGKYTKDLVYSRLAPGVLDELEKRNPSVAPGRRKVKHHQWLTDDIGHPALGEHLHTLITLMRMSSTWDQFYRYVTKAFPVYGEQLNLDLDDD
jgi:hypothetical protein